VVRAPVHVTCGIGKGKSDMKITYTVIGIQMATREDRTSVRLRDGRVPLFRVQIQAKLEVGATDWPRGIPMHDTMLSLSHPKLGDTYSLEFAPVPVASTCSDCGLPMPMEIGGLQKHGPGCSMIPF